MIPRAVGWAVVSLVLVIVGYAVAATGPDLPAANLFGVGLVVGGLCGVGAALARDEGLGPGGELLVLLGLATALAFHSLDTITHQVGYGTDAAAFNQYSAELLRHGTNPYAASMQPALTQFHVSTVNWTYRLNGSVVDSLSYPAGAFLLYLPLLLVGLGTQLANVADVGAWMLTCLLIWRLLPPTHRWAAGLLLGFWPFADYVIGGGTDALWLPFGVLAVWRWDRYADRAEPSIARWVGPVALGIAISIKQLPWFLVPFLLVGVAIEADRRGAVARRVAGRYALVVAGVFCTVNAPFMIWGPRDWLAGVSLPFRESLVADGQGLVNLSLFPGRGGGLLVAYTIAAACTFVAAVLLFAWRYVWFKRVWPLLITIVMIIPTRSYASYVLVLLPVAVVAATTTAPAPPARRAPARRLRPVAGIAAAFALVATVMAAVAVLAPAPLAITVIANRSTGELQTLDQIVVEVRNVSDRSLHPHFSVQWGGRSSAFWRAESIDSGSEADAADVPAHSTTRLRLSAPSTEAMVPISRSFVVQAFTTGPATSSRSAVQDGHTDRVVLVPPVVPETVPTGQPIVLTAQLTDLQGEPLRVAGVPVALGQVVYNQNALLPGLAAIDGHPEGQTPIQGTTDVDGGVRFSVVGVQAQAEPVYFQAWIAYPDAKPYGYSSQLAVQFRHG